MPGDPEVSGPAGIAPLPPDWLPSIEIPIYPVKAGQVLYRIHRTGHDPVFYGPGKGKPPEFRFDSANGLFGVLYVGVSFEGAFVETVLRNPQRTVVRWSAIEPRSVSHLVTSRQLRMAKLFGDGLSKLGTDNAISSGPYQFSGLWADALWAHRDRVDGIAYRSRFDSDQICLAIFEREPATVNKIATQRLDSKANEIGGLLDRYSKSLDREPLS